MTYTKPPTPINLSTYTKTPDIAYIPNGHIRQRLDLYLPKSNAGPFPCIIYIHGGAFMFGKKTTYLLPLRLLSKNYAIASLDYRLSGDAKFPSSIHDVKAAVRFLRANAQKYNLDPSRFVAMGESAGGHHSSILGVTSSTTEFDVGENLDYSSSVQGVVDYYGPSDFLAMDDIFPATGKSMLHLTPDSPESKYIGKDIREAHQLVTKANPITYIDDKTCPFFIAHGTEDHTVAYHQSVVLERALRGKGVDVTFLPVEGVDHIFKAMTKEQEGVLDAETDRFLEKIFGKVAVKSRI